MSIFFRQWRVSAPKLRRVRRMRLRFESKERRELLSTLYVTDTSDSATDTGSLRYAILQSNATPGQTNTIDFAITGTGVQTISPQSPLPAITQAVLIDGESQPGYAGTPLIEINGQSSGSDDGLTVNGSNVTIRGLDIVGFSSGAAIHISGASSTGNWVYGDFLGTDPSGQTAVPNFDGVAIQSGASNNTIGGTTPAERNLISGNSWDGVHIVDSGTTGNVVEGNFIGTDKSGSKRLGNGASGVAIFTGASNNLVGGTGAAAGNTISGGSGAGVYISDPGTTGNLVEANLIGTDASGTHALGNDGVGVAILNSATDNTIGGTAAGAGNTISGNSADGVHVAGAGTTGNLVEANLVGTDGSGTHALGNDGSGVVIATGAGNNTIGGTTAGAGNTISGNSGEGVFISDSGTTGNLVEANLIGTDASGTHALGNDGSGITIQNSATDNTIGGTTPAVRNVISGNSVDGLHILGTGTTGNVVEGDFLGTDLIGSQRLGNDYAGVAIFAGANNNLVGGTAAGAGNLISANGTNGIYISDPGTSGNAVEGNLIGTDASGTHALGNIDSGVAIQGGANNNTVGGTAAGAGNTISANSAVGVYISDPGTTGNLVEANLIGTDASGTYALGNDGTGIAIQNSATNNTIGGTTPAERNLISGNSFNGVQFAGSGTTGNVLEGNFIGTDLSGSKRVGNGASGVAIVSGASNNLLGGTGAAAGNTISGGWGDGIYISDPGTTGNLVEANLIGTDASGTHALGNNNVGVAILNSATDNTIGGTAAGAGNTISANSADGVHIAGAGTTGNLVEGNLVGTDGSGTHALGNDGSGVVIATGAGNNTIGGTTAGAGNTISGNLDEGVLISDPGTTGNLVEANLIGTDAAGTHALGNDGAGIAIQNSATDNTIGGTPPAARNVISGDSWNGLNISGIGTTGNVVEGDFLGTDITGSQRLGNDYAGVAIFAGASNNLVGGTAAGAGNLISANGGNGIYISDPGTSGNAVEGNRIGTDASGTHALGNVDSGVAIQNGASNNTVGGTAAGAGNTISANSAFGVYISDAGTTGNLVEANLIGTDASGTYALGNDGTGIAIQNSATNNTIGGTTPAERNLISGNSLNGVQLVGIGTTGNVVEGNFLGTDLSGSQRLGNDYAGVAIGAGANNNRVGGTAAGAGNLISANGGNGVYISDAGTTGNLVAANLIGTDVSGTHALGNRGSGVDIVSNATSNIIGGTAAGAGNVISGNGGAGVSVIGNSVGNQITANRIFANTGLGIALGTSTTPNPNHGNTPASGPNNLLNAPVITSAGYGSTTSVGVSFVSLPNSSYRLDFYSSPGPGSQGKNWLGSVTVKTDANGQLDQATNFSLPVATSAGSWITATATDQTGDTSEFSNALQLTLTITKVNLVLKQQMVSQIVIVFSGPVNFAAPNGLGNYQLIAAGKKNSFAIKDGAKPIPLKSAAYNAVNDTVTLIPKKPFALTRKVQLRVTGQPPRVL